MQKKKDMSVIKARNIELQKENKKLINDINNLTAKMDKLIDDKEDFYSYKIFEKARKRFFVFISIIVVFITGFGIFSLKTISNNIKNSIEEQGTEKIIENIETKFIEQNQNIIVEKTITTMNSYIENRVEEVVRDEILDRFRKAAKETTDNVSIIKAIEKTYDDEKFSVIVASSQKRDELERLLIKERERLGEDFDLFFPNAKIIPPKKNKKYFGLSLGSNLTNKEAKKIKERALLLGFDKQTFIKQDN